MNSGTKTRYIIFQILIEISKNKKNFETVFNQMIAKHNLSQKDISFVNNVCLNTMRRRIHCKIILDKFVKSTTNEKEFILLSSALVQIVFLKIKPYAVVNETVNVAKKVKIFSGFINGTLKNILKEIKSVEKTKIKLADFPKWFIHQINLNKNFNSTSFINTFYDQPSLHLVFKSEDCLQRFNKPHLKSSNKSAFIKFQSNIKEIDNYNKGEWWVQDFSSMIPLAMSSKIKNLDILDLCAAPGGKAFQVLSKNNVILNDISIKRISRLKDNLSRLNFSPKIKNMNGLNFDESNKFDLVILDSPCSSIGTIRRHPEILFSSKEPDFKNLNTLQKNLLQKSSRLVKKRGKIIYMVCSFFYSETIIIIKSFLEKNKNFSIEKFEPGQEFSEIKNLISDEGYFFTMPTKYKNHNIDGFFSVQLVNND